MTRALTVKKASFLDIGRIAEIHVESWNEVYHFMPKDLLRRKTIDYRINQWRKRVDCDDDDREVFTLLSNKSVVGFGYCIVEATPLLNTHGLIDSIYIDYRHRGNGAGLLLLSMMANWLAAHNGTPIGLWAFEQNVYRHWYSHLGATRGPRRDRVIDEFRIPEIGYYWTDTKHLLSLMNRLTQGK